mmetsp:Transcript_9810/g.9624  ORF Transcript_9810/g.9624 Transcript_9810/m.9624 type:complete len:294 (-) Transcript_9810:47-928(-)
MHDIMLKVGVNEEQFAIRSQDASLVVHSFDCAASTCAEPESGLSLFSSAPAVPLAFIDLSMARSHYKIGNPHGQLGVTLFKNKAFEKEQMLASAIAYHKNDLNLVQGREKILSDVVSLKLFKREATTDIGTVKASSFMSKIHAATPPAEINFGNVLVQGERTVACAYYDTRTGKWSRDGVSFLYDSINREGLALNARCLIQHTDNKDLFSIVAFNQESFLSFGTFIAISLAMVIFAAIAWISWKVCQQRAAESKKRGQMEGGQNTEDLEKPLLGNHDAYDRKSLFEDVELRSA